jgi:hypothetical protein
MGVEITAYFTSRAGLQQRMGTAVFWLLPIKAGMN